MTQTINNPADTGTRLSAEDGESTTNLARWPLDRSATIGVPLPPREFILLATPAGPDTPPPAPLPNPNGPPKPSVAQPVDGFDPGEFGPELYVGRHRASDDEPDRRSLLLRVLARLSEGRTR